MVPGGVVRVGVGGSSAGSCSSRSWSNGGEGGGEVGESRCKRRAGVSNWEGDEIHCSPMFLEGRDERGVFLGLGGELIFATKVSTESNLDDDNGAEFLVEGVRVRVGGVGYSLAYIKSGAVLYPAE